MAGAFLYDPCARNLCHAPRIGRNRDNTKPDLILTFRLPHLANCN